MGEFMSMCVCIWRGAVTPASFERQRSALAEVVDLHPGGAGFLCIIEATATPPNDALRRASVEMLASHGNRLKCVGCTIEGTGFKAAVTRSVLSGMALVFANRKTPVSFFANVSDTVAWMSDWLPRGATVNAVAAVAELRRSVPTLRE